MSYKVSYAGIPLHNYINIFNVKRQILPSRENFTKDIPGRHGEYYTGYKYAPREITLECALKAKTKEEYVENISSLAYILDTKGPSKLIIDDNPEKYNYAVVSGAIEPEKIKHNAKFNIKLICYDPITYSIESDFFYGDGNKKVIAVNSGSLDAYPVVNVGFQNTAHFLQCTNHEGKTVLVGQPPSVDKPNAAFNPEVLNDTCTDLTEWTPIGNIVDDAVVDGNLTINGGGFAIIAGNYGSGDKWHGPGRRKNLGASLPSFRVRARIAHNSYGDLNYVGAGPNPPITTPPSSGGGGGSGGSGGGSTQPIYVNYIINATPSLRIRSGRGTNYKQVGSIPNGKLVAVSDIRGNWGYTGYNGAVGYICMDYARIANGNNNNNNNSNDGVYKCTATPSLRIRSGRGTNYKQVGSIPINKQVTITDVKDNWGYTTYNGKSGYVSMQFMQKISSSRMARISSEPFATTFADEITNEASREDRIGKVEIYGFDINGHKLFKMSMKDSSEWYEYSEPEIQIGNIVVLDDNKTVPSPITKTVTENEKSVIKKIDSGRFGDWNNFDGYFTVERVHRNKVCYWKCKIEKIGPDGNIERSIQTNEISSSKYPEGELTNIVIFFGQYAQNIPVDLMNISEIKVTDLGEPPKPKENKPLFKNGDELIVDFSTQQITLNKLPFKQELDIGSQFFTLPVGTSEFICVSDDKNMDVEVSLQKRWI